MRSESTPFYIALAQINTVVGDFKGNVEKILDASRKALSQGASLLVCPEMTVTGYPAEDWLLRADFCERAEFWQAQLSARLKEAAPGLCVVYGGVRTASEGRHNTLFVAGAGDGKDAEPFFYDKRHLPEYGVFDEERVFAPGSGVLVVELEGGLKCGFAVCEDLWFEDVAQDLKRAGADFIVSINASPWEKGKRAAREACVAGHAAAAGLPLVYVNLTGGQDELVFDGHSFASDAKGRVVMRMDSSEGLSRLLDARALVAGTLPALETLKAPASTDAPVFSTADSPEALSELYDMLVVAVHDYVVKNGFQKVVIGLSGGVDSALVANIAADALGAQNVLAVMMPTRFTADLSLRLAKTCAENLGIRYVVRAIEPLYAAFMDVLKDDFKGLAWSEAEENLQARIRGTLLMAYSNKFSRLVLTTGNKSESAVGYSTLYGDTAGAYAPIKDILKTEVWALCREVNRRAGFERIPQEIIERPPSAELREGQRDEDSLPPYAVLDAVIAAYVENGRSTEEIAASGAAAPEVVNCVVTLIHRNEYKRRQCPVGPKVSAVAFGRDWRFPMTARMGLMQKP